MDYVKYEYLTRFLTRNAKRYAIAVMEAAMFPEIMFCTVHEASF